MRLYLPLLLMVSALTACGIVSVPLATSGKSAASLLAAPDTLNVDGQTLHLKVNAWTSNSGGINPNPFIVIVNVESESGGAVPGNIIPKRLYIVRGEQVWEANFTNEYQGPGAAESSKIVRTSSRFSDGTALNFAADLMTPQGIQLVRLAGDKIIVSPQ